MLIARTDPDVPKHHGHHLVRHRHDAAGRRDPAAREMTGHAMFNEVFLSDAQVPDDAVIGDRQQRLGRDQHHPGERAGRPRRRRRPARSPAPPCPAPSPATSSRRAGDFVPARPTTSPAADSAAATKAKEPRPPSLSAQLSSTWPGATAQITDPLIRQQLVKLHTMGEIGRYNAERLKATKAAGGDIPGMANISKLAMSDIVRLQRDLGLQIVGPAGTLHAYDGTTSRPPRRGHRQPVPGDGHRARRSTPRPRPSTAAPTRSSATSSVSGSLGLPKEPGDVNTVPFSSLPKNV